MSSRTRRHAATPHDARLIELATAKLASSGLTLADAEQLGIVPLTGAQTAALHPTFRAVRSLHIAYYGPDRAPLNDWTHAAPFYRLRYLEQDPSFAMLTDRKPIRYVQVPQTVPVAYYPRTIDWAPLCQSVDAPLILTEGELKAAKACQAGFPSIGLGGVYNWRAHKMGIEWLPSLDVVQWPRRNVYICFDSDYRENPLVCAALYELANMLQRLGAFAHLVTLPALEGFEKVGLDDYLTFAGPTAPAMFQGLLATAEPLGLSRPLWAMNQKYAYVQDPGLIINQSTRLKVAPSAFTGHLESTKTYQERKLKPDGTLSFEAVSAATAWLKWPLRTEVTRLTYQPGQSAFLTTGSEQTFNIWPGWGVTPAAGPVTLFLDLVKHLFTGAEAQAMEWFLDWCAYPLQYPGTKLFSSVVLHGIRHGTGKSLIGYTLGRIYGKNFTEISQMDLHNSFNEWAEGKQFVMGDDVTGSNKRQDADFLKKLITQQELRVNMKYVPTYVVPDCINYFFTANHPDSFFLEDDDRRFFIHEVQVGPLDEAFYMAYDLWLETGGAAAVFQWLCARDVSQFNPAAPAFKTMAKERMIANVQSDLAGWVRSLLATPDYVLRVGEIALTSDLLTSKELLHLYDPTGHTGTTANGLGRELARAGIRQVNAGRPLRTPDGAQGRYYAVRNADRWLTATPSALVAHLDATTLAMAQTPKAKY